MTNDPLHTPAIAHHIMLNLPSKSHRLLRTAWNHLAVGYLRALVRTIWALRYCWSSYRSEWMRTICSRLDVFDQRTVKAVFSVLKLHYANKQKTVMTKKIVYSSHDEQQRYSIMRYSWNTSRRRSPKNRGDETRDGAGRAVLRSDIVAVMLCNDTGRCHHSITRPTQDSVQAASAWWTGQRRAILAADQCPVAFNWRLTDCWRRLTARPLAGAVGSGFRPTLPLRCSLHWPSSVESAAKEQCRPYTARSPLDWQVHEYYLFGRGVPCFDLPRRDFLPNASGCHREMFSITSPAPARATEPTLHLSCRILIDSRYTFGGDVY